MIKLPQVTLVAYGSFVHKDAQQRALDYSCRGMEFGAVKNIIDPSCIDIDSWNKAIIYNLWKYIDTEFCILIHPDGYIINPDKWNNDWLNYDYIGAPFPVPGDSVQYRDNKGNVQRVGNSVSLRSRRLIKLASDLELEWRPFHGFTNEDGFICVNYRHIYEEHGMKFAPIEVAKWFGRELDMEENEDVDKPFTFHMSNDYQKRGRNVQYEVFE